MGLLVLLLALMVAPIRAGASQIHLFKEIFGSAAQPTFDESRQLALDQSSGDVYVVEDGDATVIKRFNPDGTPNNFSGLGTNVIDGTGSGNCATVPADCDQTPQNELSIGSNLQIAVDDSGGPTDGNIYITQSSPPVIDIFSGDGKYLGQLTESSTGLFSKACGIAVDSSGTVYVGDGPGGIHKFVPTANPPVKADNTVSFSTVTEPCGLAAGAGPTAGFLFAAHPPSEVAKLDSATGELKYNIVAPGGASVLAVDPGNGHVLSANGSRIDEFDATGSGSAAKVSELVFARVVLGIAVRGSNGNLHVSVGESPHLEVYGPLVHFPDVTTEPASSLTPTSATLNGTVNPESLPLEECKFEYGFTRKLEYGLPQSYESTVPCAQSPGTIGSGTSPVSVSADISGLKIGSIYHYRLVAENENGAVNGSDQAVQTLGPVLADLWTDSVVRTEATLKARINPEGAATTYRIEWGPTSAYGSSTPERNVGSDNALHTVKATLTGLQPDTTYHWRLVVTNSVATYESSDLAFTTYPVASGEGGCANESFRVGAAASLADCRAYEMVSPIDKNGGDVMTLCNINCKRTAHNQSSLAGDRMTYSSFKAFGDAAGGHYSNQYLATRGDSGWSTHGISPRHVNKVFFEFSTYWTLELAFRAFTPDLSSTLLFDEAKPTLTPDALENYVNLYQRDNTDDTYHALTTVPPTAIAGNPENLGYPKIEGIADDGSHSIFSAEAALTPDTSNDRAHLYDFSDGNLHLVSSLTDGSENLTAASLAGPTSDYSLSADGSRIFWVLSVNSFREPSGELYVRIDNKTTVPVSALVPGGSASASFVAANPAGSRALFLAAQTLYESDVDAETVSPIATEVEQVLGASDDLSYIYFISKADLDAGAIPGRPNLYLAHNGSFRLIGTLAMQDINNGPLPRETPRDARVTDDGRNLAFASHRSLTGYDNIDTNSGKAALEVYTYDADTDRLICASCNPSGARPVAQRLRQAFRADNRPVSTTEGEVEWAAAWLTTIENGVYLPRTLSNDGNRLFFNSFDALLPQDTNGMQDVYQWEAEGSGSCAKDGGCVSLISNGVSPKDSEFIDASRDGRDVFFSTASSLWPADQGLIDIYNARAGGGFPPPAPPPTPCLGDACQNIPSAPSDPTPASASFSGAGNPKLAKPRTRCRVRGRRSGKGGPKASRAKAKRCRRSKRRRSR